MPGPFRQVRFQSSSTDETGRQSRETSTSSDSMALRASVAMPSGGGGGHNIRTLNCVSLRAGAGEVRQFAAAANLTAGDGLGAGGHVANLWVVNQFPRQGDNLRAGRYDGQAEGAVSGEPTWASISAASAPERKTDSSISRPRLRSPASAASARARDSPNGSAA